MVWHWRNSLMATLGDSTIHLSDQNRFQMVPYSTMRTYVLSPDLWLYMCTELHFDLTFELWLYVYTELRVDLTFWWDDMTSFCWPFHQYRLIFVYLTDTWLDCLYFRNHILTLWSAGAISFLLLLWTWRFLLAFVSFFIEADWVRRIHATRCVRAQAHTGSSGGSEYV